MSCAMGSDFACTLSNRYASKPPSKRLYAMEAMTLVISVIFTFGYMCRIRYSTFPVILCYVLR